MPSSGSRASLSIPQRKLASVLPEPVGAQISALSPPEIASQPPAWAGVGPSKEASNQRRVAAENGASGSDAAGAFDLVANPSILRRSMGWLSSYYGVPPVNLVNSVHDFFGTKPFLNSPEPLQKLQVSGASSTENQ